MPPTTPEEKRTAPAEKEHRVAIRAGLFVLVAAIAMVAVVVILGNAHRMFERHTDYVSYFRDVDGLVVDSPVRLGGLSVGTVKAITFSPALDDTRVRVDLQIAADFTSRIRTDSVARVASRGLLGDKTIDISLGSSQGQPVESGGELTAGAGSDITSVLKAGSQVVDNVVAISDDVRRAVTAFTDPKVRADVTGSLNALHAVLGEVANGRGALHAVIYDPAIGQDVRALVASGNQIARRLDAAVTKVDAMLEQVRTGDGTAHALLYGPEGKQALASLSDAAAEVTILLHDVKASKNAAVHELLYGESKALVDDFSAAASSLKAITGRIDRGEGSLGALVNDPSAYEDLRTILGNVKRNRLLRELVRFTVSNRSEYADTGKPQVVAAPERAP